MNRVFLGLGGNLNKREENLSNARLAIEKTCGCIVNASGIYETEAWGSSSKNAFLNQVIEITTPLDPPSLLERILSIEEKMGRIRTNDRNSDRTIDIDILFFNADSINTSILTIPHPQIVHRKFVLIPLAEIAPELHHPLLQQSIKELVHSCEDTLKVTRYFPFRIPPYICIEGNIGSGKSTLAKALAIHLGGHYIAEQFESFYLLPLFYQEPERFAFSVEFNFLLNRFEKLTECFEKQNLPVISDYSIYKSLCFAKANLSANELNVFENQFLNLVQNLPEPDLIVHLNAPIDQLLSNIRRRARPFEKIISEAYLRQVQFSYTSVFSGLKHINQIHIEVENYHPQLETEHIKIIERHLFESFAETP